MWILKGDFKVIGVWWANIQKNSHQCDIEPHTLTSKLANEMLNTIKYVVLSSWLLDVIDINMEECLGGIAQAVIS